MHWKKRKLNEYPEPKQMSADLEAPSLASDLLIDTYRQTPGTSGLQQASKAFINQQSVLMDIPTELPPTEKKIVSGSITYTKNGPELSLINCDNEEAIIALPADFTKGPFCTFPVYKKDNYDVIRSSHETAKQLDEFAQTEAMKGYIKSLSYYEETKKQINMQLSVINSGLNLQGLSALNTSECQNIVPDEESSVNPIDTNIPSASTTNIPSSQNHKMKRVGKPCKKEVNALSKNKKPSQTDSFLIKMLQKDNPFICTKPIPTPPIYSSSAILLELCKSLNKVLFKDVDQASNIIQAVLQFVSSNRDTLTTSLNISADLLSFTFPWAEILQDKIQPDENPFNRLNWIATDLDYSTTISKRKCQMTGVRYQRFNFAISLLLARACDALGINVPFDFNTRFFEYATSTFDIISDEDKFKFVHNITTTKFRLPPFVNLEEYPNGEVDKDWGSTKEWLRRNWNYLYGFHSDYNSHSFMSNRERERFNVCVREAAKEKGCNPSDIWSASKKPERKIKK